jgi:hypothetical protein
LEEQAGKAKGDEQRVHDVSRPNKPALKTSLDVVEFRLEDVKLINGGLLLER